MLEVSLLLALLATMLFTDLLTEYFPNRDNLVATCTIVEDSPLYQSPELLVNDDRTTIWSVTLGAANVVGGLIWLPPPIVEFPSLCMYHIQGR